MLVEEGSADRRGVPDYVDRIGESSRKRAWHGHDMYSDANDKSDVNDKSYATGSREQETEEQMGELAAVTDLLKERTASGMPYMPCDQTMVYRGVVYEASSTPLSVSQVAASSRQEYMSAGTEHVG